MFDQRCVWYPPVFSASSCILAVPLHSPELFVPSATDYPNWQDLPPMASCVLGHAHVCMCVYVCVRHNLKQVSVISPVEAPAQRELIIHTVTLFTVALILPSLPLPALFQGLGHKFSSLPKGFQIRSIKWFWVVFWKLNASARRQPSFEQKVTAIIGKPLLISISFWRAVKLNHIAAIQFGCGNSLYPAQSVCYWFSDARFVQMKQMVFCRFVPWLMPGRNYIIWRVWASFSHPFNFSPSIIIHGFNCYSKVLPV